MAVPTLISAFEFMDMLKSNGLVIVSMADHEAAKEYAQKRAMKKISLCCKDIADLELLGKINRRTVQQWIRSGRIKPTEWYAENSGKKRIMVLTVAIKRLQNGF